MNRMNNLTDLIDSFLEDNTRVNNLNIRSGSASASPIVDAAGANVYCFYSYEAIIAYWHDGKLFITTNEYSRTTKKQINAIKKIASIKKINYTEIAF